MEIYSVESLIMKMSHTTENGAICHVRSWLKDKLINWESYESLEWSDVVQVNVPPYKYVVYHKFNHKNDKGYMNRCSVTFYLDKSGHVVNFHEWSNS